MIGHRLRHIAHRHWALLLWLVLLVPVAQVAVQAHALAHEVPAAAGDDGAPGHAAQCVLCLAASALGSAAPTQVSLPTQFGAADPGFASGPSLPAERAQRTWAYRSRAPPAFLH